MIFEPFILKSTLIWLPGIILTKVYKSIFNIDIGKILSNLTDRLIHWMESSCQRCHFP